MNTIKNVLEKNPNGVLATQDGEGVKTRVFQYLFILDNKVYFCTSTGKPVYNQILANPNISFCTYSSDFSPVLTFEGKAVFDENIDLKKRALDENPQIKGIYESENNPTFKLFYIEVKEAELFTFTEGNKTIKI